LRIKALPYVGNLFTAEGLKPDPATVEAILKLSKPTDVTAVQIFQIFLRNVRCSVD